MLLQVIAIIALADHTIFATHTSLLRGDMDHMRQLATAASEMLLQAIAIITLTNHMLFIIHAR